MCPAKNIRMWKYFKGIYNIQWIRKAVIKIFFTKNLNPDIFTAELTHQNFKVSIPTHKWLKLFHKLEKRRCLKPSPFPWSHCATLTGLEHRDQARASNSQNPLAGWSAGIKSYATMLSFQCFWSQYYLDSELDKHKGKLQTIIHTGGKKSQQYTGKPNWNSLLNNSVTMIKLVLLYEYRNGSIYINQ